MGLFFKDTIFLKESCDLENEIFELENLKGKVVDNEELTKYIKFLRAGLNGERAIEYELKNARIGMYVLHDVNIQHEGLNAQIDYVIITPAHCYLVESKNMVGDITIDNRGQFIRKMPWGKAESIYSPITQAQRHVDILKKKRDSESNAIEKTITMISGDTYYQPLVVVANSNGILNTKWAKKEVKDKIVRVDALIEYLSRDVKNAKITDLASKNSMEKQAQYILGLNTPKESNNWSDRFELVQTDKIDETAEKSLLDKLTNYRKEESKKRGYPAYYIYNNDQMEKLAKIKPQTVSELNSILEPVKVRMYGEDIIRIIKEG